MNLKANKKKVLISLGVMILWYILVYAYYALLPCSCEGVEFGSGTDFHYLLPVQAGCHCSPTSSQTVMFHWFIVLILPFIFPYFYMSKKDM